MSTAPDTRLPAAVRIAYGAPAFALAAIGIPIYVYLPKFYTDVVGVSVGAVGAILLAARLFDAVTDPLIGSISDRTRTRIGRRRPYLLGAAPPLALTLYMVFSPPPVTVELATWWFAAGVFAVFLFWTIIVVPYEALGPELSFDYDERTSLLGLRDGLLLAGTLVAASSPALVSYIGGYGSDPQSQRALFSTLAIMYAPLILLTVLVCVVSVSELPSRPAEPIGLSFGRFRELLGNRPFAVLLVAYTVAAFGSNLPATLILYYVNYVLESERANLFLLIYFVTGVGFLPLWVFAARRAEKKTVYLASMILNTGAFMGVYFLGRGDEIAYGVLVFLSGIGFGATIAIPSAMQADVIDYDELRSGQRREGQYVGVWSIARKLAAAVGVGASLWLLDLVGYVPNVEQSEPVRHALRLMYAMVPSLCNLLSIFVVMAYPISRAKHRQILEAIEARKRGEPLVDPLATT